MSKLTHTVIRGVHEQVNDAVVLLRHRIRAEKSALKRLEEANIAGTGLRQDEIVAAITAMENGVESLTDALACLGAPL